MLPLAAGEAAGSQVEARCRVGEVMAVWGGATLPHWESKAVWCSAVRRVTPSSPNQPQNLLYILTQICLSVGEDGTPTIRPLETLHNALSLCQVDSFLHHVTTANFKTPGSSPR